jgi:hypothetical protein
MIRDILTCAEVIDRTMQQAREAASRVNSILSDDAAAAHTQANGGARYAARA